MRCWYWPIYKKKSAIKKHFTLKWFCYSPESETNTKVSTQNLHHIPSFCLSTSSPLSRMQTDLFFALTPRCTHWHWTNHVTSPQRASAVSSCLDPVLQANRGARDKSSRGPIMPLVEDLGPTWRGAARTSKPRVWRFMRKRYHPLAVTRTPTNDVTASSEQGCNMRTCDIQAPREPRHIL